MSNKSAGSAFERELCNVLANAGFWVHNFAQNTAGQPADIIAVRNCAAYLIDAKLCENNRFSFARVEDNQVTAMKLWRARGNGNGWFALKIDSGIYMLSFLIYEHMSTEEAGLSKSQIEGLCVPLERWAK